MGAIPKVFRLGFQVRRSWEEGLGFKAKSLVNPSGGVVREEGKGWPFNGGLGHV